MNNSYLHLLQISISNLYRQKNKIKENLENLFENEDNTKKIIEFFQYIFEKNPLLNEIDGINVIIKKFLNENQLLINK